MTAAEGPSVTAVRRVLKRTSEDLGNARAYQEREQKSVRKRALEIRGMEADVRDLRRALGKLTED